MSQALTDDTPTQAIGVVAPRRAGPLQWINSHRPRGRWLNLLLVLLLLVAVVVAFLVIGNPVSTAVPVRTVAVSRGMVTASVTGSGNATASLSTPVSFQTNGTLTEVDVKAGDTVTQGEVLAKIDPTSANASLRTAQAQLENAQAAYAQAASGPTAVKQQQDQLAITQAQQGVTNANTTLGQAKNQRGLDETSTNTAIDNAQSKLSDDRSSTNTSIRTAQTTLNADQGTLTRARTAAAASTSCATTNLGGSNPPRPATVVTVTPSATVGAAAVTTTVTTTCPADFATYKAAAATVARDKLSVTSAEQTQSATLDTDKQAVTTAKQDQDQTLAKDDATISTDQQQVTTEQGMVNTNRLTAQADLHPETPDQIAQSKSDVDSAQVTVDTANKTVADTTLLAPQAGVILSLNGKVGETSGSGANTTTTSGSTTTTATTATTSGSNSSFVTIANLSDLAVDANIAEADADKIKLGQAATVTFPANGATATGSVTQITPQTTVTNNVVLYPVQISLDTAPAGISVGATASLSVTTGSVSGVLEAPTAAITTLGNRHTVTVHRGTGSTATDTVVPVEIGLSGNTTTEITTGVSEGDQLVLATTGATTTTGSGAGFPRAGGGG